MPSVMEPAERDFWIAVTLWGAALVTVFGCGLYAFIEQSFAYGAVFTITGLGGLMYMTSHLRGRRLSPRVGAMATMLAVTWGLIGYQVWLSQNKPAFEAQKSTLIGWLQQAQHECDEARQELAQLQKQMKAARSTPGMMTFPVPGKRQPDPQVCAYLLQQLANAPQAEAKNQQQPVWHELGNSLEDDVRSVMKKIGCLSDETIR